MGAPTSAKVHVGEASSTSAGIRRVGRYLLCDPIGAGGMATIHLARLLGPEGFSRTVAIKQLHPQFAQNPQFVAMLLDEARLAVRVRHVNVVSPLDIVATGAELFIVMDYVHGESFANLLAASEEPLRPSLAAAILVQVLLGLHAAHEATREQGDALGLVHRDVSPQNVLVGQDGVARMVDFGIAKAVSRTQTTDGGMVKGKLGYMAPEQIRLEPVDRRTDLFSAGVVLWEALTGTGLFVADSLGASIELVLRGEIAPPSRFNPAVSAELDAVVLKALARDRAERFQDGTSMATALQQATPLASALEITDWVTELAGAELARKADLVRRAERQSWEPPRAPNALGAPAAARPRVAGPRALEQGKVVVAPADLSLTLPPVSRARLVEAQLAATALMSRARSRTAPAAPGSAAAATGSGSRRRRPRGLALGVALAGLGAALGLLSLSTVEGEGVLGVARRAFAPAPAHELPAPPRTVVDQAALGAASSAAPLAPSRALEVLPASTVESPAAVLAEVDAPAPSFATEAALRDARAKSRRSSQSKPKQRKAPRAKNDEQRPALARSCDPPWVFDEQQVKVFKAECLR